MYNSGIYFIKNKINNKLYIGSAQDFNERWARHKTTLNTKTHHNKHLENAWDKYSEDNFEFIVVLYCDIDNLLYYEQLFLDKYFDNCFNCYNICPTAGSCLGRYHTDETKQKMKKPRIKRVCLCGCGEEFEVLPSKPKRYVFGHNMRGKPQKPNKGNTIYPKEIIKKCEGCKKDFISKKIKGKNYFKYCSRSCQAQHNSRSWAKEEIELLKIDKNPPNRTAASINAKKVLLRKEKILPPTNTIKLNTKLAKEIRQEYKIGEISQSELATKYGITRSGIQQVLRNKTWKEKEDDNETK